MLGTKFFANENANRSVNFTKQSTTDSTIFHLGSAPEIVVSYID